MNKYLIYFLLFSTVLCPFPTCAESSDPFKVGFGKNIMPNGRFAGNELPPQTLLRQHHNYGCELISLT